MSARKTVTQEDGHTLLEVVLVLSLLGLLAAAALPAVTRLYAHYELAVAARDVTVQIRLAQMSAWAHQDVHEVVFDRFRPAYTLWEDGRFHAAKSLPQSLRYLSGYLEKGVSQLRFDPSGATTGTGAMYLTNRAREQVKVSVAVASGLVTSEEVRR